VNFKKVLSKPLVRLLKECQEYSPSHAIQTDPQPLPQVFDLEEIKENIYRRRKTKVAAKNGKRSHERPIVRMKLGGGNIQLGQQDTFEGGEGQPKPQSSKEGLVNEAERTLGVGGLIRTH